VLAARSGRKPRRQARATASFLSRHSCHQPLLLGPDPGACPAGFVSPSWSRKRAVRIETSPRAADSSPKSLRQGSLLLGPLRSRSRLHRTLRGADVARRLIRAYLIYYQFVKLFLSPQSSVVTYQSISPQLLSVLSSQLLLIRSPLLQLTTDNGLQRTTDNFSIRNSTDRIATPYQTPRKFSEEDENSIPRSRRRKAEFRLRLSGHGEGARFAVSVLNC